MLISKNVGGWLLICLALPVSTVAKLTMSCSILTIYWMMATWIARLVGGVHRHWFYVIRPGFNCYARIVTGAKSIGVVSGYGYGNMGTLHVSTQIRQ